MILIPLLSAATLHCAEDCATPHTPCHCSLRCAKIAALIILPFTSGVDIGLILWGYGYSSRIAILSGTLFATTLAICFIAIGMSMLLPRLHQSRNSA